MAADDLPFGPEVIAAVTSHMNTDHPADNVLIVRALGGIPDATEATMTGLDADGLQFETTVGDGTVIASVPWAVPITERATVRQEVVRMYLEACEALGVAPRAEGEH